MRRSDVVIVGAGTAGCVLAARLSQRGSRSVLLLDAGHETAFQVQVQLPDGRTYVQGWGVGGSAAINAMVATVGEPADYDDWERRFGCSGWSWRDVRPWFRRVELPARRVRSRDRGVLSAAVLWSVPGAESARLTRWADGGRAAAKEVYLDPVRDRSNLVVRSDAAVDRVLLDGRRAVGVRLADGECIEAGAVLVSAGALQSPAILLRSGIDHDAVGSGLHDHASLSIKLVSLAGRDRPTGLPVTALARTSHSSVRDVQVVPFDGSEGPSLLAAAMHTHSRGRVCFSSPDATASAEPIIDFNTLADERDVQLLRAAAVHAIQIAANPTVSRVARLAADWVADESMLSDEALRSASGDYFHAAGSCRMGDANDSRAVVDERCRVIGYDGLVVCDASVMPNLPRANPCLPTVMIAERVAAMLDEQLER